MHALVAAAALVTAMVSLGLGLRTAHADDAAWQLAGTPGHVVLMRHANAPGFGDPKGYRLDDCATQRNLDAAGRAQARRIRSAAARHRLVFDVVLSSAWCRCLETARLATGQEPEIAPALNSFFDDPARRPTQVSAIYTGTRALAPDVRVLMVTHQVVISALTGRATASGEMIVARREPDGSLIAVATIAPP
ncbi:MAG: histidine phosphatase family protein [Hyphomicrobiaceae bacterium]